MSQQAHHLYEFGPFRLDAKKRLLRRNDEVVRLTAKSLDILLALVESRGEVVSKDELMRQVWPGSFVEEGNLTYNISVLRKALGERAGEHQYIVTVPGRGYRFVASVSEVPSGRAEDPAQEQSEFSEVYQAKADREKDAGQQQATPLSRVSEYAPPHAGDFNATSRAAENTLAWSGRRKFLFGAVALIAILLISVAGYWLFAPTSPKPIDTAARKPITTVAVLPLSNGSADPDMEYLSDGISESLINSLSQMSGIKVIARSSSFRYKGKDTDPQEVARSLGVEAILTGRVVQRGESLLIGVELVDGRDRTQVWGEQYNRRAIDLLALESEISGEIARSLRLKLTTDEQQRLAKQATINPQAYELLLKGRFNSNRGGTENMKKAVEYYQQAIAIDPDYALAYAQLSMDYYRLAALGVLDQKEILPKVEAAALKALELDEGLPEAHIATVSIKQNRWDWAAAERELNRAIELNPNLAIAHRFYSFHLSCMKRHEQAISEARRARELDPLSPRAGWNYGYQLLLARQNDQAIEAAKWTLDLDPNYPEAYALIGHAHAAKGQYQEAIAAYKKAIKLGATTPDTQIYLGAAYARAGDVKEARAILKRLEASKPYISLTTLADFYVALGEHEQALAALERAYAAYDTGLTVLSIDPYFDPLRSDPRFQDLLHRIGLPQ